MLKGESVKHGIICQACGIEAPTRYVEFYQNVGALITRFHKKIRGNLCKGCVHKYFWKMTSTTLAVGWLGMISIIVAPIFILNNLFRYLMCLGMPAAPDGARAPVVDNNVTEKVFPLLPKIFERLNNKERLEDVAQSIAPKGLTPGQVFTYVALVIRSQKQQAAAQPRTGGFPVITSPASNPTTT